MLQRIMGRAMLGKLRALLTSILGNPAAGSGVKPRRPRRFVPGLEGLESRVVPAIQVTTTADVVADGGKVSLREAISRANAREGRDTIVLGSGVYKIGLAGAGENANASGDFDVTGPLIIRGQGAGATFI